MRTHPFAPPYFQTAPSASLLPDFFDLLQVDTLSLAAQLAARLTLCPTLYLPLVDLIPYTGLLIIQGGLESDLYSVDFASLLSDGLSDESVIDALFGLCYLVEQFLVVDLSVRRPLHFILLPADALTPEYQHLHLLLVDEVVVVSDRLVVFHPPGVQLDQSGELLHVQRQGVHG